MNPNTHLVQIDLEENKFKVIFLNFFSFFKCWFKKGDCIMNISLCITLTRD